MTRNLDVPDEYAALYRVYEDAYEQASEGKGKERHASEGEAYEDQIICEVARRVGLGYPLGQAVKKIYESQRLGGESGVAELLGAINYIAAAVIVMREGLEAAPKAEGCEEPAYNPDYDVVGGVVTLAWPRGKVLEKLYASGRVEKCAEGCEELVQKDAPLCEERCEEFIPGLGTCEGCCHAREQDAPQTKEELCQRIVDSNPSVYPRTPTGEELAEMAEEVTHE